MQSPITVETTVSKNIETVWELWTGPEHIQAWNHATEDWECPRAENDLRVGGHFSAIMAAKDGSGSFDFNGIYTAVDRPALLEYAMEGGRQVSVRFESVDGGTKITERFEPETLNSRELQRSGWQSILNTFKHYAEQSRI
jgi:uncharacterized protein YndB with AHSA1/START domain